jgi:TolA-binding protein
MGKGIDKNRSAVKIAILFSIILFTALDTYAGYKESELFDQSYEYYLSSQPEKAAEAFRTFLNEFPDTSLKDAAMFWLGKSLIQLYSFEEAKQVFSEMKQQSPESPFIAYLDRETEDISRIEFVVHKLKAELNDTVKAKIALEEMLAKIEKKAQLSEQDLSVAVEDRDKLRLWLEEEKAITEELKARLHDLEEKDAEVKILQDKLNEYQKNQEVRDEYLKQLTNERGQLDTQIQNLTNETEDLRVKIKEYEVIVSAIEEEKKKTEEFQVRIRELEGKETVLKILLAQVEEKQKDWNKEKDKFNSRIQQLEKDKAQVESEGEKLKNSVKEYEDVLTMIKEKAEEDISAALNAKNTLETRIAEIEKRVEITEEDMSTTEHPLEPETKQERKLMYSVHIALYGKKANAEELSREYVKKGYDAYVKKAVSKDGGKTSYRVLIGKFENKEEASRMAKQIHDKEKIKVFVFSE